MRKKKIFLKNVEGSKDLKLNVYLLIGLVFDDLVSCLLYRNVIRKKN